MSPKNQVIMQGLMEQLAASVLQDTSPETVENVESVPVEKTVERSLKNYPCRYCGKTVEGKIGLALHIPQCPSNSVPPNVMWRYENKKQGVHQHLIRELRNNPVNNDEPSHSCPFPWCKMHSVGNGKLIESRYWIHLLFEHTREQYSRRGPLPGYPQVADHEYTFAEAVGEMQRVFNEHKLDLDKLCRLITGPSSI